MNKADEMAQSIVSGLNNGASKDIALGKARDVIKEIRQDTIEECAEFVLTHAYCTNDENPTPKILEVHKQNSRSAVAMAEAIRNMEKN